MAEASRSNATAGEVTYPTGASGQVGRRLEPDLSAPELPKQTSVNPALNRSAEVVGRGVGTAVAGVRSLPRQIDKLRSRIHLVGSQSRAGAVEMIDSAAEAAAEWRDQAEEKAAELKRKAEVYTYEVADRANRRLEELQQRTQVRIGVLRRKPRLWLAEARRWQAEKPVQFIAACAAAGFVAGIALRIWRSNSV